MMHLRKGSGAGAAKLTTSSVSGCTRNDRLQAPAPVHSPGLMYYLHTMIMMSQPHAVALGLFQIAVK